MKLIDITGRVYGRLTVVGRHSKDNKGNILWKCLCECGKQTLVRGYPLKIGAIRSCGCAPRISNYYVKHGLYKHPLYYIWHSMHFRCCNESSKDYKNYGGRGIIICERWQSIENFIEDMYPTYKEGLTINRIDINGNYCKENCEWATDSVQNHFRRKQENCSSQYIGVTFSKARSKFIAQMKSNGKNNNLGGFINEYDAATAYDNASEKLFGDRPNGTTNKEK